MARRKGLPSRAKAKEIMRHGEVHGQPLSTKQRGFFGVLAGGSKMRGRRTLKGRR